MQESTPGSNRYNKMQQNSNPPSNSNGYDGGKSVGDDMIGDGIPRDPLIPGPLFTAETPELLSGMPLHPANGSQFGSSMPSIADPAWNELNYDDQPSMHGDNVAYEDPEIKYENDIVHPRPYNYEYPSASRSQLHDIPRPELADGSLGYNKRFSDHTEPPSYGYNQQYSHYREYDQYRQYDDQARPYYATNDPQPDEFADPTAMRNTRTLDDIPSELLAGLSAEDKEILSQYPSLLGEPNVRSDHQSQRPPNQNPSHPRQRYQNADQMGDAIQRRMSTTLWEEEGTICFVVEVNGIPVTRRCDNNMINGTKLLNSAQISRGRRDGVLKGEKVRHVVKIGGMNFKGVWIPFERALDMASREQVLDALYPLFTADLSGILYNPHHSSRLRQQLAKGARHNPRFNDWINGIPPRSDFSTWHSFNLKGSTPSTYDTAQRPRIKRPSESLSGSLMHPGYETPYAPPPHRQFFRSNTRTIPQRSLPPPVPPNGDSPRIPNHYLPMYRSPPGFPRADQYDARDSPSYAMMGNDMGHHKKLSYYSQQLRQARDSRRHNRGPSINTDPGLTLNTQLPDHMRFSGVPSATSVTSSDSYPRSPSQIPPQHRRDNSSCSSREDPRNLLN